MVAAALGGVRLWGITYPAFDAEAAIADSGVLDALTRRLHTLYLGAPHDSSALHRRVHGRLSTTDPTDRALLDPLRDAARLGFAALARGDLGAYGVQMVANHEAQRRLDPELISDLADHVVAVAALAGARGWKVNGAGGNGGSLAILGPDDDRADADLIAAVAAVEGVEVLAARVAGDGVRIVSR